MNKEEAIRRFLYVLGETECLHANFGTMSENHILNDLNCWLKDYKEIYEKCIQILIQHQHKEETKHENLDNSIKEIRNYLFTC